MSNAQSNSEWAKNVQAMVHDLNLMLEEHVARDVIVTGSVAMNVGLLYIGGSNHLKPIPVISVTLSERLAS